MAKRRSKESKRKKEEDIILTFLQRTKEGKFAKVEPITLEYGRVSAMTEPNYEEEAYLFSYS